MEKSLLQKISLCLFLAASLQAASLGGYGGATHRSPVGASAWARGGASSANPELAFAYWNPAAAGTVEGLNLSFGGAVLPLGRGDGFIAGEGRVGRSRIGISGLFLYRGVSDLGEQYQSDDVKISSGEKYSNLTTKLGMSFALSRQFSLGFAMSHYYSSFPVDYRNNKIVYGKSSILGGVTLMGAWQFQNGMSFSAGVRDLFTTESWDQKSDDGGYAATLNDTSLAVWLVGYSQEWEVVGQKIRFDSDLSVMAMDSYLKPIESPFASWNNGLSWSPNTLFDFRVGFRDFLLTSTMFSNKEIYKIESTGSLTGGIAIDLSEKLEISDLTINYALSGSGIGSGINHHFDFLFEF